MKTNKTSISQSTENIPQRVKVVSPSRQTRSVRPLVSVAKSQSARPSGFFPKRTRRRVTEVR